MNVRPATEADREPLHALWDEFAGSGGPPPWADGGREESKAGIDAALRAGAAAVSELDGAIAGFACGVLRTERLGEVTELYVRPHARRRGLARRLLRAVVAGLRERGAEFVTVETGVDNHAAQALFASAGLRPEALRLIADAGELERRLVDDSARCETSPDG